jgi:hypothetical protein
MAVHGFVHVVGSSTVTSYFRVSSLTRVNRSVSRRFSRAALNSLFGEKFVVSTTSVSPSQRPRASPFH